jgi:hypothetical protein
MLRHRLMEHRCFRPPARVPVPAPRVVLSSPACAASPTSARRHKVRAALRVAISVPLPGLCGSRAIVNTEIGGP